MRRYLRLSNNNSSGDGDAAAKRLLEARALLQSPSLARLLSALIGRLLKGNHNIKTRTFVNHIYVNNRCAK